MVDAFVGAYDELDTSDPDGWYELGCLLADLYFESPTAGGEKAVVTDTGSELVAFSSVCPHLGCKVHWDDTERGFICPCHGGFFDAQGKALRGPPAEQGQQLKRFPLKTIGSSIFIVVKEHLS